MFCIYCASETPTDALFCRHCGKQFDRVMTTPSIACRSCRAANPNDATFCWNCGQRLERESPPAGLILPEPLLGMSGGSGQAAGGSVPMVQGTPQISGVGSVSGTPQLPGSLPAGNVAPPGGVTSGSLSGNVAPPGSASSWSPYGGSAAQPGPPLGKRTSREHGCWLRATLAVFIPTSTPISSSCSSSPSARVTDASTASGSSP